MKIREKLENLNPYQRWAMVLISGLPGIIFYFVLRNDDSVLFGFLMLYAPLALAAVLLNFFEISLFTIAIFITAMVNFFLIGRSLWESVIFLGGIAFNFYFWLSWNRRTDLQTFQFQKTNEQLDLSINDARAEREKVERSYKANQVKIQHYTALNELGRSLSGAFKTQDVVVLLIETISKIFMAPGGVYTLLLFDSSVSKASHLVRYSVDTDIEARLDRTRLHPDNPFNVWVVAQKKPLVINDTANDFRFQDIAVDNKVQSLVAAPFMGGGELLGLIRMESSIPKAFHQEDVRLLSNFCDLGTIALEHMALYDQTKELSTSDGLTGLLVQRYYKDRVRDEIFRSLEHNLPLSILMIDVDHFKSYNDRYGHLVGDKVLQLIAKVLKESVRTVDLTSRYGGEEFSVLSLRTPAEGALLVAERIRQNVEEQEMEVAGQKTHVTVSIGVAELNQNFKDAEAFINSADQALYQAKSDGRNRVCLAKTEPNHG